MLAAAIFDMDGLLIDSERAIMRAWLDAARALSMPLDEPTFLTIIGRALPDSTAILSAALGGIEAYHAVRARAHETLAGMAYPPRPGARAVLARLAQRELPCAVASSTRRAEVERRLAAADLHRHFAALAAGDEVSRGKPDPAVYLLAAERLGVDPRACIAFEDSDHGVHAAHAAGMRVVMVPDLKPPPPDAPPGLIVLRSLADAVEHDELWA